MTYSVRSFLLVSLGVLAAACGSSGLSTDDGGAVDGATNGKDLASSSADLSGSDLSVPISGADLAGLDFGGVTCGSQTCGATETCCTSVSGTTVTQTCTMDTTCGDGGIAASCDGPEDCPTAMADCCVNLTTTNGTMGVSGAAACTASCPASAAQSPSGGFELATKLCHSSADCANYSGTAPVLGNTAFDSCCSYQGASFDFCAPSLITALASQVTCP